MFETAVAFEAHHRETLKISGSGDRFSHYQLMLSKGPLDFFYFPIKGIFLRSLNHATATEKTQEKLLSVGQVV